MGTFGGESVAAHCPFSGRPISVSDLFSGAFEIEHLIPFPGAVDSINTRSYPPAMRTVSGGTDTYVKRLAAVRGIINGKRLWRAAKFYREMQWRFSADAMENLRKKTVVWQEC
ncbi:MAG: HNH endonuclease domain-containing protein [Alphaproteobacteria bacterium]